MADVPNIKDGQNFKLDVMDYLSHDHKKYVHALEEFALTNPSKYYEMRGKIIEGLGVLLQEQFTAYYEMLTSGKFKAGGKDYEISVPFAGRQIGPSIAKQRASAFSLAATETLDEIISEAVEMVMPASIQEISRMRLTKLQDNSLISGRAL